MYSRELLETIEQDTFTIWIYRDYGYKYEISASYETEGYSAYDRWYGKKSYGSKAEALKAGKVKVKQLIKTVQKAA